MATNKLMKFMLLFFAVSLSIAATELTWGSRANDYAFETSAPMLQTIYLLGHEAAASTIYDALGASSVININADRTPPDLSTFLIEEQRGATDLIIYGLANRDPSVTLKIEPSPGAVTVPTSVRPIEWGIKVLQWGLHHQRADGSYPNSTDSFHSTAFFVEAVSHACLMIEQSPYAAQFVNFTTSAGLAIAKSVAWMQANEASNLSNEQRYGHRYFLDGDCFIETGALINNPVMIAHGAGYITRGATAQWANGVMPELGGYDSSYQAVGMGFGTRLLEYVTDPTLSATLYHMLKLGLFWEASRIYPTGDPDLFGNTRVKSSGTTETDPGTGALKVFAWHSCVSAMTHWSLQGGGSALYHGGTPAAYIDIAEQIFDTANPGL
jgi:hypothetical protein